MYDMYPWDTAVFPRPGASRAARRPAPPAAAGCPAAVSHRVATARRAAADRSGQPPRPAVLALQVALDRRDNGGAGAPAGR
jgi:hypothetical protein